MVSSTSMGSDVRKHLVAGWTCTGLTANNLCTSTWTGITCTGTVVTKMDFTSRNLAGNLVSSFGLLTGLKTLILDSNAFGGQIPTSIGALTGLTLLSANSNNFGGSIPTELGYLTNLVLLDLSANVIGSTVPTQLSKLSKLTSLNIYQNKLTGSVPSQIAQLPLINFQANNNLFSQKLLDPSAFTGLLSRTITYLDISSNSLTGTVPSIYNSMSQLQTLNLYANFLSGRVPAPITSTSWSSLKVLTIFNNRFSGPIPTNLGWATRIVDMELSQNKLTGTIPTAIGNLKSVTTLTFTSNSVSGSVPIALCTIPSLSYVGVAAGNKKSTMCCPSCLLQTARTSDCGLISVCA